MTVLESKPRATACVGRLQGHVLLRNSAAKLYATSSHAALGERQRTTVARRLRAQDALGAAEPHGPGHSRVVGAHRLPPMGSGGTLAERRMRFAIFSSCLDFCLFSLEAKRVKSNCDFRLSTWSNFHKIKSKRINTTTTFYSHKSCSLAVGVMISPHRHWN